MDEKNLNIDDIVSKWLDSSDQNYKTMNNMLKQKISIGLCLWGI